jgi:autotransporter-associated beta strand protein
MGGSSQTYIMPSFMNLSVSGSANTIQIDPTNTAIITKNRLGSGLLSYVNNGTMQFNSQDAITLSDPISGIGGLAQIGPGTLTLAGANSYSGSTIVNGGTLNIANSNGAGLDNGNPIIVNQGGTLDFLGVNIGSKAIILNGGTLTDQTSTLASSITLTANSFLSAGMNQGVMGGQPTANNLILNGVISDGGNGYGLVISGVGNVTFSNINSYSGLTTINGGNLFLTGLGSIAASGGLVNNGSFDISGTYAGAVVKSYSGNGILILGNQVLTIAPSPQTETISANRSGFQADTVISNATTNVLTQITATSKVITSPPAAAPITGTEVISNSTDNFASKTLTQTNTPSTTVSETTTVNTDVKSQNLVGSEFQAPAVNVTTTSNTQTSTGAPVTAATTSSGSTVTKVAPASQAAPPTSPVIVSKPVPTDSADLGDKTLALVKPPVEASEPPKQPTRNDVRVTTTTVASGVAIQKVDPIKPSSTEFYNQVISGLWNAK